MRLPDFVARAGACLGRFFSKFNTHKVQIPASAGLAAFGVVTLFAGVSSADSAAQRLHLLPLIVDGEGIQSRLIVNNVSNSSSHCSLDFSGPELDTGRFEDHFLPMLDDARATFELEEQGGNLIWASEGERSLTFGYARLDCAEPVAAQVLYSVSIADELLSMTSMFSGRKADEFQFSLIPQVGSLELIFANDVNPEASCEIELKNRHGSILDETSFPVPEMTSVFQTVEDLFRIPEDFVEGAVRIDCDQEVAATGFIVSGGIFTTLSPTIFTPAPAPDSAD